MNTTHCDFKVINCFNPKNIIRKLYDRVPIIAVSKRLTFYVHGSVIKNSYLFEQFNRRFKRVLFTPNTSICT